MNVDTNTARFKWDVLFSQIDIRKFPKLPQSVFRAKNEFVSDVYQFQGISFLLVYMKYHHVVQSVLWHIRTQIQIEAPHCTKLSLAYSTGNRHDDNRSSPIRSFSPCDNLFTCFRTSLKVSALQRSLFCRTSWNSDQSVWIPVYLWCYERFFVRQLLIVG